VYEASAEAERRLLNQAFFTKLRLCEDHIESELAPPYDVLLHPTLRASIQASRSAAEEPASRVAPAVPEPDWAAWEASFNEDTHEEDLAGVGACRRPGRQGLNSETLVHDGGRGAQPRAAGTLPPRRDARGRLVLVLARPGGNGAGGLVAARQLASAGAELDVRLAVLPERLRPVTAA
jgi:hypothetical protein